jgi:hypothetical protein
VPSSPSEAINPATVPAVRPEIRTAGEELLLEVMIDLLLPKLESVAPMLNKVPYDADESPVISI